MKQVHELSSVTATESKGENGMTFRISKSVKTDTKWNRNWRGFGGQYYLRKCILIHSLKSPYCKSHGLYMTMNAKFSRRTMEFFFPRPHNLLTNIIFHNVSKRFVIHSMTKEVTHSDSILREQRKFDKELCLRQICKWFRLVWLRMNKSHGGSGIAVTVANIEVPKQSLHAEHSLYLLGRDQYAISMPRRRTIRCYKLLTEFGRGRKVGLREAGWSARQICSRNRAVLTWL